MQDRSIIHLNITDFAVAVERICDTSLKNHPIIIALQHASRALVYDMSEEAYGDGVRKGMKLSVARRHCRQAQILDPRIALYRKAMTALVKQVDTYTPMVEPGTEDGHLFLDVTGTHRLFGPAPDIAWQLRKKVLRGIGLDPVWSVASNKLVAKVASRMVRPLGEYIVGTGEEDAFLAPLPLSLLPGLQQDEIKMLRSFNLQRIGELAMLSRQQLLVPFPKRGAYLYDASRGRDLSPVLQKRCAQHSITAEYAFAEDTVKYNDLKNGISNMVQKVARELRRQHLLCRRVMIILHYSDGRSAQRQALHKKGTDNNFQLHSLCLTALARAWKRRIRIRCCTLACDRLTPKSVQQTLFTMQSKQERQQQKIMTALDAVHARFGSKSMQLGAVS